VPHHHIDPVGYQLGGGVGGHLRLADVVLHQQLHLLAIDAALGVALRDHQFGRIDTGQTIGGQVTTVGTGHTELDGVRRHRRRCQYRTHSGDQ